MVRNKVVRIGWWRDFFYGYFGGSFCVFSLQLYVAFYRSVENVGGKKESEKKLRFCMENLSKGGGKGEKERESGELVR